MNLMGIRHNLGFGKAGFKNFRKKLDNSTASKFKKTNSKQTKHDQKILKAVNRHNSDPKT